MQPNVGYTLVRCPGSPGHRVRSKTSGQADRIGGNWKVNGSLKAKRCSNSATKFPNQNLKKRPPKLHAITRELHATFLQNCVTVEFPELHAAKLHANYTHHLGPFRPQKCFKRSTTYPIWTPLGPSRAGFLEIEDRDRARNRVRDKGQGQGQGPRRGRLVHSTVYITLTPD